MCDVCGCGDTKRVSVELHGSLLADNDHEAAHLRAHFRADAVTAINLMGSPGSGKTALLEATARALGGRYGLAAVSGDLATTHDADRLAKAGIPSAAITTGTACHLEASMVDRALHGSDAGAAIHGCDFFFIENVGNLVCPAIYDLGQRANVVALSVTEGVDKPLKYPVMFRHADLVVLTKIDLLPHLAGRVRRGDPRRARARDAESAHDRAVGHARDGARRVDRVARGRARGDARRAGDRDGRRSELLRGRVAPRWRSSCTARVGDVRNRRARQSTQQGGVRKAGKTLRMELLKAQQELVGADWPVIVLLGGVDAAGKGDVMNRLFEWMDPRGLSSHAVDKPTQDERERPEYWRFWMALPPNGRIGIFHGGWYAAAIEAHVARELDDDAFGAALGRVNGFERT